MQSQFSIVRTSILILVATIIAGLLYSLSAEIGSAFPVARTYIILCLIISLASLLHSTTSSGERTFSIVFNIYFVFFLLIPGLLQTAKGVYPFYRKTYDSSVINKASLIILIYLVCTNISYFLCRSWQSRRLRSSIAQSQSTQTKLRVGSRMLLPIALNTIAITGFFVIGPARFLSRRDDYAGMGALDPIQAMGLTFVHMASFLALVLFCLYWRAKVVRSRFLVAVSIPLLTACFIITNDPINIPRYFLFCYIIVFGFLALNSESFLFKWLMVISFGLGEATLFPMISVLSRGARGSALITDPLSYFTEAGDLDGFQSMLNAVAMVSEQGIAYGAHVVSALLVFIPRSFWPGKAVGAGDDAAKVVGYLFRNVSMPLPGEFFIDGGWPGVLFIGALSGFLLATIEVATGRARRERADFTLLTGGLVVGFTTIALRGSMIGISGQIGLSLFMAFGLARVCEVRTRSRSHRSDPPWRGQIGRKAGSSLPKIGGARPPRANQRKMNAISD